MTALSLRRVIDEALADVGAAAVRFAAPRGRPRETVWLTIEAGFGLRRYASGRSVYIVQTRMAGRVRTVTIGPTAVLSEPQAASVAKRVLAHALVGNDPAEDRKRIRSAPSFDDFLQEYWRKCAPTWKPTTRETLTNYRCNHVDGAFPGRYVDELDRHEVAKWFAGVTDRSGLEAGNSVLQIVRMAMNKAESWGYRPENSNPCQGLRFNKRRRHERFLSSDELGRVGPVLQADLAGDNVIRRVQASAVLLLLLTGCRHSEVRQLQWPEVNGSRLKLRDSKSGPRTVWLGAPARAIIDGLPRHDKIPWLFWNPVTKRPIGPLCDYWHKVQATAGIKGLRVHDLRHSFASHAATNAETMPMVARLLGHAKVTTTMRYAHLDDGHILEAAQQAGDLIERLMTLG